MNDVHRVADLPGSTAPGTSSRRSNEAIPEYFASYEQEHQLPALRPVKVESVHNTTNNPDLLEVQASDGRTWLTQIVVSASDTWAHPFLPYYPSREKFRGVQIHTAGYTDPEKFRNKKVIMVGAGVSAAQLIGEVAHTASEVLWATRPSRTSLAHRRA